MSLNYNLSKIKDHQTTCFQPDGEMIPATKNLVYMTIAVGIPEITEKNHETFRRRLNTWEKVYGYAPTEADVVKAHVGLKTNATPYTEPQFVTRIKTALYNKLVADMSPRPE